MVLKGVRPPACRVSEASSSGKADCGNLQAEAGRAPPAYKAVASSWLGWAILRHCSERYCVSGAEQSRLFFIFTKVRDSFTFNIFFIYCITILLHHYIAPRIFVPLLKTNLIHLVKHLLLQPINNRQDLSMQRHSGEDLGEIFEEDVDKVNKKGKEQVHRKKLEVHRKKQGKAEHKEHEEHKEYKEYEA